MVHRVQAGNLDGFRRLSDDQCLSSSVWSQVLNNVLGLWDLEDNPAITILAM